MEDEVASDNSLYNIPLNSESGSASELDCGEVLSNNPGITESTWKFGKIFLRKKIKHCDLDKYASVRLV